MVFCFLRKACWPRESGEPRGLPYSNGGSDTPAARRELSLQPEPARPPPPDDARAPAAAQRLSAPMPRAPAAPQEEAEAAEPPAAVEAAWSVEDDEHPPDAPGAYVVIRQGEVCRTSDMDGTAVAELAIGDRIHVQEVRNFPRAQRIRGRIADPPGWTPILATNDRYRWAVAASQTDEAGTKEAKQETVGGQQPRSAPKLSGMLYKKRGGSHVTRQFDYRYCVVRDMMLLYYASQAHAESAQAQSPDGGPKVKGRVVFHSTRCRTERDPSNPDIFSIIPEVAWDDGSGKGGNRQFIFDTKGSSHSCDEWMAVINAHIHQAHGAPQQAVSPEAYRKSQDKVKNLLDYSFS